MDYPKNVVSLHPYFEVHPGRLDQFKAMFPAFVATTAKEQGVLFYEFTVSGDEVFCREAYAGAEAALAHLGDVGGLLAEAGKISTLARLEIHGPAEELDKMRAPLAHLSAKWFVREAGL